MTHCNDNCNCNKNNPPVFWHNADTDKPEPEDRVLVCCDLYYNMPEHHTEEYDPDRYIFFIGYWANSRWYNTSLPPTREADENEFNYRAEVTHWAEMPEGP